MYQSILRLAKACHARTRLTLGLKPLSYFWGHERGLPICRYYVESFLREFSADIRGHCLEFQEDRYATRFGGAAVTHLDILHHDDSNPGATIVADLTRSNTIPSNQFDCIICTFVLHVIFEASAAVAELQRILKPSGVLLIAVPHISMCAPEYHEIWRFTPEGLQRILEALFGPGNVDVRGYGNSLTAAGQIRGLVPDDFTSSELEFRDERFAVIACGRAIKKA